MSNLKRVFFVAGEVSGDYSASFLADIISDYSSVSGVEVLMFGVGGDCLRASGVRVIDDIIPYSSIGFLESVVPALSLFGKLSSILSYIKAGGIDLVILVDNQGINLRIARFAKRAGISVVYYFPPHVSIWGSWNVRKLRGFVDLILCPFYDDYVLYRGGGTRAAYVGHYLCDIIGNISGGIGWRARFPVSLVGLFPGSRRREFRVHLPILLGAAYRLSKERSLSFVLVIASKHVEDLVSGVLDLYEGKLDISVRRAVCGGFRDYLYCDMAIAVSGTVSLELGLLGIPMLIIYRVNYASYFIAKLFLRTEYISMVNILLGEGLVSELVGSFGVDDVFVRALDLVVDREFFLFQRVGLSRLWDLLYKEGARDFICKELSSYLV